MSDKLKQLEIKKLLTEYDYLVIDEEMKNEIIDEYRSVFMEKLGEKIGVSDTDENKPKEEPKEKEEESENVEKKAKEKLIKDEDLSDETKKNMKKMFREIMKKTHPDKVNSEHLVNIYIKSKEAYETNNILELSYNASKLDIPVELSDLDIEILKDLIKYKKTELDTIEKSWLWLWYSADTEKQKDSVILLYYHKMYKSKNNKDTDNITKIDNNKNNKTKTMENLNTTLNAIYSVSPYGEYKNNTNFGGTRNDVYGEVTQISTNGIVNEFKNHFNENTVFYDLGCGLGKMVAHIGLQYNPKKSCGIEFSKERINGANHIKETYCKDNDKISFIHGSFLDQDISDATVAYCDNTMYNNELTEKIINTLPKGCLFICRRKPFLEDKSIEITELKKHTFETTYKKSVIHYLIK
jgi:SAM-dependent methyltransferase